jgi:hypothetical protein
MKTFIAIAAAALTLAPASARAEERLGDAALGALSGAVVLGPVGLVAGAVIGYTAGPAISRSWRANRNHPRQRVRAAKRPAHVAAKPRASAPGEVSPPRPAPGTGGPPVQGLE